MDATGRPFARTEANDEEPAAAACDPSLPATAAPAATPNAFDFAPAALLVASLSPAAPIPRLLRLGAALAALPIATVAKNRKKAFYAFYSPEHGCDVYTTWDQCAKWCVARPETSTEAAQHTTKLARPLRALPATMACAHPSP